MLSHRRVGLTRRGTGSTAEVCFLAAAAVPKRRHAKPGRAGRACVRVAEPTSRTWDLQRARRKRPGLLPGNFAAIEPCPTSAWRSRALPACALVAALPPGASEVYCHPAEGVRARDGAVPARVRLAIRREFSQPPAACSVSGSSGASSRTTTGAGAGAPAGTAPTATIRPSRWIRSTCPLQRT